MRGEKDLYILLYVCVQFVFCVVNCCFVFLICVSRVLVFNHIFNIWFCGGLLSLLLLVVLFCFVFVCCCCVVFWVCWFCACGLHCVVVGLCVCVVVFRTWIAMISAHRALCLYDWTLLAWGCYIKFEVHVFCVCIVFVVVSWYVFSGYVDCVVVVSLLCCVCRCLFRIWIWY